MTEKMTKKRLIINYYLHEKSRGEDVRTPLTDILVDSKGHIVVGYCTSESVAFLSDLSNYVTSGELENKGYITSSELDGKGYVTQTELNSKGYITAVTELNHYTPSTSTGSWQNSNAGVWNSTRPITDIQIDSNGHIIMVQKSESEFAYKSELNGYVPTERTVNGKTLSQDITINSVASATTSKSATTASSASSVAWSNVKNAPSFASSDHTHSEYVKKTGDTMSGTLRINSTSTALTCTGETEFRGTMNIRTSDFYDDKNVIFSVNGLARVYGLGIKEGGLYVTGATSLSGNTSIEGDVTVTGKVSASSGFFQTSDRRLKNFQGDIEVDFDKLKSIPKKYFYWNMDSKKSKLEIGTSAQEVMEVYPELVSINEAGMLSVAYDKLSVIALKAVDELHEENVALKEKNDELERRLKAIEEKLGI